MSSAPPLAVLLQLGRVSNLPTVWTNTLAAVMLSGGSATDTRLPLLLLAMSLFYTGGMYLNDAFDADIDARERPERPIPSGLISRPAVYMAGSAMLGAGLIGLALAGLAWPDGTGSAALLAGLALTASIVFYDWHHKSNPLSPVVMGVCRVFVYIGAAAAISVPISWLVLVGAALLLCYVIGLTYVAKQENLARVENMWPLAFLAVPFVWGVWAVATTPSSAGFLLLFAVWVAYALKLVLRRGKGDIPKAVVSLIAGISLLDAMLIASTGQTSVALVALAGFATTLFFQRYVSGT